MNRSLKPRPKRSRTVLARKKPTIRKVKTTRVIQKSSVSRRSDRIKDAEGYTGARGSARSATSGIP